MIGLNVHRVIYTCGTTLELTFFTNCEIPLSKTHMHNNMPSDRLITKMMDGATLLNEDET